MQTFQSIVCVLLENGCFQELKIHKEFERMQCLEAGEGVKSLLTSPTHT